MPSSPPFGIAPPGYRLPAGTRVGAVHLQVADLERSLRFYQQTLGFQVLEPDAAGTGDTLLSARSGGEERNVNPAPLVRLRARPGTRPARRGGLGLYHFAILLPDRAALGALLAHLDASGTAFGGGDHLVSEALYLADPDGLGIEVYADRPRDAWQARGGELVMTTEPLDADGLLREAGGRRWEGLPPGTRIGHVHLSVGDLAGAEAFYHRALGFDKVVWSYPGALFFSAGGYHHHVGTNTWGRGGPAFDDEARLLWWELQVPASDDAAAAARSLEGAGYAVEPDRAGGFRAGDPWGQVLHFSISAGPKC
jgi:catechol 2,3-dioxygenase